MKIITGTRSDWGRLTLASLLNPLAHLHCSGVWRMPDSLGGSRGRSSSTEGTVCSLLGSYSRKSAWGTGAAGPHHVGQRLTEGSAQGEWTSTGVAPGCSHAGALLSVLGSLGTLLQLSGGGHGEGVPWWSGDRAQRSWPLGDQLSPSGHPQDQTLSYAGLLCWPWVLGLGGSLGTCSHPWKPQEA